MRNSCKVITVMARKEERGRQRTQKRFCGYSEGGHAVGLCDMRGWMVGKE